MDNPIDLAKAAKTGNNAVKVSPLRGMAVADWIAQKVSPAQESLVEALIQLVHETAPHASLAIKWAQPVFDLNGPMIFIKSAKAHVTFGFWRGAMLSDPRRLLEGGETMKHVKLRPDEELDRRYLASLVEEAARLNRELGDPTRRA